MHFFDISTSKSGPNLVCFVHFEWKCASRQNGAHFFDIATSKSGPNVRCFVRFDFEMCFAPQRRAIFHLSSGQLAPHPSLSSLLFSSRLVSSRLVSSLLFSSLPFPSLPFSSLLFSILLLHLCFSSVHIVGSSTSKLPSNMSRDTVWQTFSLLAHDGNYYLERPLARNVMYFKHGRGTFCIFLYPFYILVSLYPIAIFPQPI